MCQGNIFSPQIAKRENTVYVSVTVTEYRYVPVLTAAAHAQPTKVAQANIPVIYAYKSCIVTVPAAAHVPSNGDALTFTSYAGLLNTIPPASYPTLWSETVPSVSAQNALKSDSSSILLTAPGHSNGQIPRPTLLTEKIFVKTTRDYRSTEHSLTTSPTRTSDTPSSTEDISSTRSLKPEKTIADNDKSSMAMTTNPESTSTDMTVSSITTRGHVTRTMTSVGSDGTTTVMTEYPLSTQKHTTQSASGAMRVSGWSISVIWSNNDGAVV
ncbi:hypothetical protein BGZ76_004356 [Entomortierella beljakovae]|nr:hypothetical protein BGZ76_004356 [Entomortierella beljakovae]